LILTALRSGEVRGAPWDEIDLAGKLWSIPAERMKAKQPHRVPLSGQALAILETMATVQEGALVFPGVKAGKPISRLAMMRVLHGLGFSHVTVHGFRSTFRDWAAEQTNLPREVCEAALAHTVRVTQRRDISAAIF
jgi:integrase